MNSKLYNIMKQKISIFSKKQDDLGFVTKVDCFWNFDHRRLLHIRYWRIFLSKNRASRHVKQPVHIRTYTQCKFDYLSSGTVPRWSSLNIDAGRTRSLDIFRLTRSRIIPVLLFFFFLFPIRFTDRSICHGYLCCKYSLASFACFSIFFHLSVDNKINVVMWHHFYIWTETRWNFHVKQIY